MSDPAQGSQQDTFGFDESVMLDSPWMAWAAPWIEALQQQPKNQSFWPFDQLCVIVDGSVLDLFDRR